MRYMYGWVLFKWHEMFRLYEKNEFNNIKK